MNAPKHFFASDSIIFDLDGTLWDSTDVCLGAWHDAIRELPYVMHPVARAEIEGVMGLHHSLIGDRLFPYLNAVQRSEVMERCYAQEIEAIRRAGGKIYGGVEDVLEALSSRFRLFIVSNCQSGYIEAFHSYHNLERLFSDWECSGDTGLTKAENIRLVIERNTLSKPIYVGDTKGDADAAKECGVPFVFASYGFGSVADADAAIASFDELRRLL